MCVRTAVTYVIFECYSRSNQSVVLLHSQEDVSTSLRGSNWRLPRTSRYLIIPLPEPGENLFTGVIPLDPWWKTDVPSSRLTRVLILAPTRAGNFTSVLYAIKNSSVATACVRRRINHTQSRSAFHPKFSVNTQDLRHENFFFKKKKGRPRKRKKSVEKLGWNKFSTYVRRRDDARSCRLQLQRSIYDARYAEKNGAVLATRRFALHTHREILLWR